MKSPSYPSTKAVATAGRRLRLPMLLAALTLGLTSPTPAAADTLGGMAKNAQVAPRIDVSGEIECLALNIYHEARGESDLGKRAVGHVVLNRVSDRRFPATICEVVREGGSKRRFRCQFSWWCDGRSDQPDNRKAWERSKALARAVFWGYSNDPTLGALWYHTRSVKPVWRKALLRGPNIGHHVFYVGDRREGSS